MSLTLGSLFSGSGGFELGGKLAGITPLWASEIEPFPIAVTRKNLPEVRHLGDVRDINGADVTPVDVLTFGSCCQDLSNSGKKAGLDGSRSCLFFEAIRIIKEMRAATNGKYPRYAVFENVKGLFWVGQGEDFRRVLEQFCSVVGYEDKKTSYQSLTDGEAQDASWQMISVLLGGCSMLQAGAYPKDVKESTLLQILQDRVPLKYCLSPKACAGILARAESRGKIIPEVLKRALERQAQGSI